MPPPSQSPGTASSVSPTSRESYSTAASHVPRYSYPPHGHSEYTTNSQPLSMLNASRSLESYRGMSPSTGTSGYVSSNASQAEIFSTLGSQASVPPFKPTRTFNRVRDFKGVGVNVDLQAKIDKGFFKADQDWTCYRRNYFAVMVHYLLKPYSTKSEPLYLDQSGGGGSERIVSFAACIVARVDGEDGKVIELVQHTPKRDKGPMGRPEKVRLLPHTSGGFGMYPEAGGGLSPRSQLSADCDAPYAPTSPTQQQNQTVATFDRIQFKNATANNGKRRAAQQYFHIIAELYAEISSGSSSSENQWVKIASRMSAPMVVRGRSPGHYSDDRRGSSASRGGPGGGSSGDSGGSQRDPQSRAGGGPPTGVTGMFSNPPRFGSGSSGNYLSHRPSSDRSASETQSNQSSASSEYGKYPGHPFGQQEPILTAEEEHAIQNTEGYQYYPSTLLEALGTNGPARPVLSSLLHSQPENSYGYKTSTPDGIRAPGAGVDQGPVVKEEHLNRSASSDHSQYGRPGGSEQAKNSIGIRGCGRFQGVSTSKGFYPETPAW